MSAHDEDPPWGGVPPAGPDPERPEAGEAPGPDGRPSADRPDRAASGAAPPPSLPLGLVVAFYGALLGVAWIWREWVDGVPPFRAADAAPGALGGWPVHLLLGAVAGVALAYASRAWSERSEAGARLSRELARLLGRVSAGRAVALALLSGVAEEAFFRGALQPRVGLVAASLLFGLAHFVPRRAFLPWTGFSVVAGFLLGGLFELTGNLIAPVVAHALINGVNLSLLTRLYGEPEAPEEGAPPPPEAGS